MRRIVGAIMFLGGIAIFLLGEAGHVKWGWHWSLHMLGCVIGAFLFVFGVGVFVSDFTKGDNQQ